jgi:hypothetical protein
MSMAANNAALSRNAAAFLVERAERKTGSRMVAYHDVATKVGATPDWIRKFIKGQEAKEPKWTIGWNLIEHCYELLCSRVEQELDEERSRIETLKRDIDAAIAPFGRMVANAERAQAPREVAGPALGKDP